MSLLIDVIQRDLIKLETENELLKIQLVQARGILLKLKHWAEQEVVPVSMAVEYDEDLYKCDVMVAKIAEAIK